MPEAPRSRGRPRAFDRDAALTQAMRLFWQRGYEATSIADLTAAMGIGAPSLYAAFGSKEALYIEAVGHYQVRYEAVAWGGFFTAATARDAVEALLQASATALTGGAADAPRGCMVTLSFVGDERLPELAEAMRGTRSVSLARVAARIEQDKASGALPKGLDARALARFVQTVQSGMSILARDGAGAEELAGVAATAMMGWDARVGASDQAGTSVTKL